MSTNFFNTLDTFKDFDEIDALTVRGRVRSIIQRIDYTLDKVFDLDGTTRTYLFNLKAILIAAYTRIKEYSDADYVIYATAGSVPQLRLYIDKYNSALQVAQSYQDTIRGVTENGKVPIGSKYDPTLSFSTLRDFDLGTTDSSIIKNKPNSRAIWFILGGTIITLGALQLLLQLKSNVAEPPRYMY